MDESRYRQAERGLWDAVGGRPHERRVRLADHGTDVRIQEIGTGHPVLFLTQLPTLATTPQFADRFAVDLLDALDIERADLVASSFGGYLALRAAARHPDRFGRMVQLGCPAFCPGMRTPAMLRVLASPLRHVIRRLPADERGARMALRQIGHGHSLAAGKIPAPLMAWHRALQGDSATFVHDAAMIAQLASPLRGADPSLTLPRHLLQSIRHPTLVIWGADDPFGDVHVGQDLVEALGDAELTVIPHGGHLPWLDEPDGCAELIRTHLSATASA